MKTYNLVIFAKGDKNLLCNKLREEYVKALNEGVHYLRIFVVSDAPIREWFDYVKCVLIDNIALTITVHQVSPMKLDDYLVNLRDYKKIGVNE
jgi:hypothetical protein